MFKSDVKIPFKIEFGSQINNISLENSFKSKCKGNGNTNFENTFQSRSYKYNLKKRENEC